MEFCVPNYSTWVQPEKSLEEVGYCSHLIQCAKHDEDWNTIARLLRTGDRLAMHWYRDASTNGYMRDRGLHGDRLYLRVYRGANTLTFCIHSQCCEDNTARMIRRGPYNHE